jgi:beta-aspartyl-peptidase (threonine type)
MTFSIIVHGGAWSIPPSLQKPSQLGCEVAVKVGSDILESGGTALDAVEAAVRELENNPCFDAGYGSLLNSAGYVETDALIMDGSTLATGAVAGVRNTKNTVSLARAVMERTQHTLLVGSGARDFATEIGIPFNSDEELVTEFAKEDLARHKEYGTAVNKLFHIDGHDTVGCVAFDSLGNIACATSTGGITNKRVGRVGDSPLCGCGGYANEVGGCSATGHGEALTKCAISYRAVSSLERDGDATPDEAARRALEYAFNRVNARGGLIMIDKNGKIGKYATTPCMAWAAVEGGEMTSGVANDEEYSLFPEKSE